MPKVRVGNVVIECDSVDEAVQIASRLQSAKVETPTDTPVQNPQLDSGSYTGSRWTEARLKEFYKHVKGQQRKVIDALLDNPDGRTDRQLLQVLGWSDGKMLAGVLSGLAKNAKKVEVSVGELYTKHPLTIGEATVKEYKLTESFRSAVQRYGR